MDTKMLRQSGLPPDHDAFKRALSPESVAELLVRGIEAEKFLIGNQGPADAAVELEEDEENPGYYSSKFFLKPHYQLEGLSVSLRLVSRMPK